MRKFSFLVLVSIFIATIAYAELGTPVTGTLDSFELRNGIQFLMTDTDIRAKESLELDDTMYSRNKNHLNIYGALAGVDNAIGEYIFNNEWRLVSFLYMFDGTVSNPKPRDLVQYEYNEVEDTLVKKYGNKLEGISAITSDGLLDDLDTIQDQKYGELLNLSERLLKINSGGYVKIEHWAYSISLPNIDSDMTSHIVQYTYYTDDYVDSIFTAVKNEENQKNNDL